MKKLFIHVMAVLLVPWYACQESKTDPSAAAAVALPATTMADMVLPNAKDTTLPSGRHNTYLIRSRDQHGIFVERSDFPAGYIGMPHVHNEELYVTILKGSVYFAFGDRLDTTLKIKPYGPGSFFVIPADKAHYEWFTEACTMQIEGMGPQSTYFISQKSGNP
jgi:quercetin dioxygenase-like cupin family protein